MEKKKITKGLAIFLVVLSVSLVLGGCVKKRAPQVKKQPPQAQPGGGRLTPGGQATPSETPADTTGGGVMTKDADIDKVLKDLDTLDDLDKKQGGTEGDDTDIDNF